MADHCNYDDNNDDEDNDDNYDNDDEDDNVNYDDNDDDDNDDVDDNLKRFQGRRGPAQLADNDWHLHQPFPHHSNHCFVMMMMTKMMTKVPKYCICVAKKMLFCRKKMKYDIFGRKL